MPPRPSLQAVRRYATVAADATAAASSSSSAAPAAADAAPRTYTDRKAFLHGYYGHLLRRSQLLLLFTHDNLSVADSRALRAAIAAVPLPKSAEEDAAAPERAALTIARTGLLRNVVAADASSAAAALAPHLNGQAALLTSPTLSPRYLSGVLAAIERSLKKVQRSEDNAKQPALKLVAGVLEGNRVLTPEAIKDVSKLPELDQLRALLVGLLEQPGRQLIGVLSQAGGGALVRTLQGLEQGLKDKEEQPSA
ncbi:50S ribosomal protein L10 [Vanrija pseudolonga]|uniref:50S ribosomal protein L10 n=1 Tax=Vanrija pseudolonga TaxID=143232 RepID=A0AAF0Y790_9TREE|nr:50S ribosomal protein L10 [Vanrija pseudolonga]